MGAGHRRGDRPDGDEWALPGLVCACCGTVTFAAPPPGADAGPVSYGPVLNAAAVLLTAYGNVPPERAARLMGMLLGAEVSAGWVDKAGARLSALLGKAGLDAAMLAALAGEKALAADETAVNVLDKTAPPAGHEEKEEDRRRRTARPPPVRRTCSSSAPRRAADLAAGHRLPAQGRRRRRDPAAFTGALITDGYTGYQHLLSRLAGISNAPST